MYFLQYDTVLLTQTMAHQHIYNAHSVVILVVCKYSIMNLRHFLVDFTYILWQSESVGNSFAAFIRK